MREPVYMYLERYRSPLGSFRNWQLMIVVVCVNCPQALIELMKVLSDKAVTQMDRQASYVSKYSS